MTKKLNSFILPNDVIEKMKDKIRESEHTGKEHGFILCKKYNSDVLIDRAHCAGNECSIKIKRICRHDEDLIGDYHTHPGMSANPSLRDMITQYDIGLGCIGSVEDNEIKCFVRKDKMPDKSVIPSIKKIIETYEEPLERMTVEDIISGKGKHLEEKLIRSAHYFRDHYFKEIVID